VLFIWMRCYITVITVVCLLFSGSHNSGCYDMKKNLGLGADADHAVRNLASLPFIGAIASDVIFR
jgi:hypothetical protein